MSTHSNRNSYRNGSGVRPVPTSDKGDIPKPHNVAATLTNAPDPIVYGISFVFIVFGLTFLIVGGVYTGKCTLQSMLPIWLLVMGIIVLAGGVASGIYFYRTKRSPFRRVHVVEKIVAAVILIIFFSWFIAGNVWVYSAWGEDPDYGHDWFENGCNKSIFLLSFSAIIVMDAMVGLILIGMCFWGVSKVVVRE